MKAKKSAVVNQAVHYKYFYGKLDTYFEIGIVYTTNSFCFWWRGLIDMILHEEVWKKGFLVIRANDNLLVKVSLNIQIDRKSFSDRLKQRSLHKLKGDSRISRTIWMKGLFTPFWWRITLFGIRRCFWFSVINVPFAKHLPQHSKPIETKWTNE